MRYKILKVEHSDGRCFYRLKLKQRLLARWSECERKFDTVEQAKDYIRRLNDKPTVSFVEKGKI